jgi:hypothetical protein
VLAGVLRAVLNIVLEYADGKPVIFSSFIQARCCVAHPVVA